jgi:hypothetical protein
MQEKEYSLSIEIRTSYLIARVRGIRNLNTVLEITKEILNNILVNNLPRVMVDIRELKGRLRIRDYFNLLTRGYHVIWSNEVSKVAIVDGPKMVSCEWLIETVARKSGINLKIFKTQLEAFQWLAID